MKLHPAYIALLAVMSVLLLIGIALLVWGAVHQGPPARMNYIPIPPMLHHG